MLISSTRHTNLLTLSDLAREDAAKSVHLACPITGCNHLSDIDYHRPVCITVPDSVGTRIVEGTVIEVADVIPLRTGWGWQVEDKHVQQHLARRQPRVHHPLHELLARKCFISGFTSTPRRYSMDQTCILSSLTQALITIHRVS
jgi:hypothetical protein